MLKQKCDAWREEAEKLAPLRDEVGRLHTHASALEEEIKFLKANNEGLGKQLQVCVQLESELILNDWCIFVQRLNIVAEFELCILS